MANTLKPQQSDQQLSCSVEDQEVSPFTLFSRQTHGLDNAINHDIIELVPEPVVQHAKGEDTMPTPEERLNALEFNFNQFKAETVKSYGEMAHEVTLLKGIVLDSSAKLTILSNKIDQLDQRFEAVDVRLNSMDAHIGFLDKRLNRLEIVQNEHTTRLDRIEIVQNEHTTRLDRIEAVQNEHTTRLDRIEAVQNEHTTLLTEHTTRLGRIETMLGQILERLPAKA